MAIGIDFGTTNSSIVHHGEGGATLVEVGIGLEPYPAVLRSAVFTGSDGSVELGRAAFDAFTNDDAGDLLTSFKPLFNEERLRQPVLVLRTLVRTGVHDYVDGGTATSTELVPDVRYGPHSRDEVVMAASLVIGRLLEELKAQVDLSDDDLAEEDIYIGVPVGYGPTARRRLLDALVRAGLCGGATNGAAYRRALGRVRFVYEPIALIPLAEVFEPETVLVFDYGGGTLDIGIWEAEPAGGDIRFRQLALGGHPRAGDSLDRLLLDHLIASEPEYAHAVGDGPAGPDTLRRIAELKEELSRSETAPIQEGGADPIEVTRADLESVLAPELAAVAETLEACVARAGIGRHEIDRIVMSGGSSLVPCVRDLLWRLFPTVTADMFSWPDPTDVESSRAALTGVSRGLAEFGWQEQIASSSPLSASIPGDLLVWSEPEGRMEEIAPQGTPIGDDPLRSIVHVGPGTVSVAVYERIASERLVVCLEDVPVPPAGKVVLEVNPDRFGLVPRVRAIVGGTVLRSVDLGAWSDVALANLLRRDGGWSPDGTPLKCGYLARPLRLDDYVRVPGLIENGVVTGIERISTGLAVQVMEGWALSEYRVFVTGEKNGSVAQQVRRHSQVLLH